MSTKQIETNDVDGSQLSQLSQTELEVEELERNLAENDSYKEDERSADDTGSHLGEEVRDILTAWEEDEEIRKAILRKKRLPLLKKQQGCQKEDRKTSYHSQRYIREEVIRGDC